MGFEAGDLPHPGKHYVVSLPLAAGIITKGDFVHTVAGNAEEMNGTHTTIDGVYVAVESVDFSKGDTSIQVAGPGSQVIVVMGGSQEPGSMVQILNGGKQTAPTTSTDLEGEFVIGRYLKHPGETVATASNALDLGIIKLGVI